MAVLLDTNILVDYFRERQEARLLIERFRQKPAISVCTIMELFAGATKRTEEQLIDNLPATITVIPVTHAIARIAGQHSKHFRASHGLDDIDALIAATAQYHDLEFATLNVKHFPMFRKLKPAY